LSEETKPLDIVKNFSILSTGAFIGKFSGLALRVVVARFLGVEVLGIYILLNLIVSYYSYSFLGISYVLPREIPRLQTNNELEKINQTRSIINIFYLFMSLVLFVSFTIYLLFFHQENISQFTTLNLLLIFITAFFYQFTTLITKHIKSLGIFSKLYINESFIKIVSPLVAIVFIIQFGLNGYLFSNLLFAVLNFANFLYYNYAKQLKLLRVNYFSLSKLIDHIKLGFAMLMSYKSNNIMYTLLFTYLGTNFSLQTIGEIGFIVSFLNVVAPLLKPYFASTERIIYRTETVVDPLIENISGGKQLIFKDFFNLSIISGLLIGLALQSISTILKYIIPIFFTEFTESIQFLPIVGILFFVINSLILINYYLNAYHIYKSRNIVAIISLVIFMVGSQLPIFTYDPTFLLAFFISLTAIYKIIIHRFASKNFQESFTVFKMIFYEFTVAILLFICITIMTKETFTPIKDIGLIVLFSLLALSPRIKNLKETLKDLEKFFTK
tara:strand:- start:28478 stop:29971 length:1494 start_codon:yes stop_codon:yes gene_type:complete